MRLVHLIFQALATITMNYLFTLFACFGVAAVALSAASSVPRIVQGPVEEEGVLVHLVEEGRHVV